MLSSGVLQQTDKSTGGVGNSVAETVHPGSLQVTAQKKKPVPAFYFSLVLFPPFCRVLPEKNCGVADCNSHYDPFYNQQCACR